ncbi:unnamed protein product [Strongylus vulgaris]|uniref:Ionotropic glutamate receptor C-terminal domain-containing protein n=1 Tax=Strongylus vulgaris TaxID=40348 RepID=A0A3P7IW29_STRVU|nr:unnamed protein product [Strongylus vulgaris]
MSLAQHTGLPTIQIIRSSWNDLREKPIDSGFKNYIYMIPTLTVFNNVMLDVLPMLNVTSGATVFFDDIHGKFNFFLTSDKLNALSTGNIDNLREEFAVLPIAVNYVHLETDPPALQQQIKQFPAHGNIIMVAATPTVEAVAKEVEVAFYFDVMNYIFEFVTSMSGSHNYTCYSEPPKPPIVFEDATNKLNYPPPEYGSFRQLSTSTYYQVTAYFLEIASWTIVDKIALLYGSINVDIKAITEYRIVTLRQPPFVQLSGNPEKPYEGYCIDLIDLIREEVCIVLAHVLKAGFNLDGLQLNFTYTIYEVEDGSFGSMDQNGNWNGLIGALVSGSADIALAPLSVTAERENDVDFTVPYYDLVGTTILMKKPNVEYSLFKFMKVLEWPVWLCIVAAYLLTSTTLWIFDRFSPYSYTNNKKRYISDVEKRAFSFKECLWFCMTSLTPQGGGEAPKNISGRLAAATWWLFGFIIIASYTANLAAFLTVSRLEQPISSLDDLAKQYKIEYAPIKGGASETYFRRMAEIEERFYNIWKEMSLNETMSPRERARLAVWDYPVSDKFTNMWSILVLLNQRRLETLKEKWWNNNPKKVVCPDTNSENDGISIQNIGGVFIVILAGIILSVITLTIEYFYYRLGYLV